MEVKRLVEHLDQNELHEKYQSAYKSLHGTETAPLHAYNDITRALDKKQGSSVCNGRLVFSLKTIDQNQLLDFMDVCSQR